MSITLRINNMFRDYCNNFLSYLYINRGWKRTMFDMAKENFIPSNKGNNRIVITNDGTIILECHSMFDILNSMEFLTDELNYGRINYLKYDEKVKMSSIIKYMEIEEQEVSEIIKKYEDEIITENHYIKTEVLVFSALFIWLTATIVEYF